jgi:hypothetical protein
MLSQLASKHSSVDLLRQLAALDLKLHHALKSNDAVAVAKIRQDRSIKLLAFYRA